MQVKTKDGWHELHVTVKPEHLCGQMTLDVIWEPMSHAFREAMNASEGRRQALFRANEQAPEQLFWVLFSRVRDVRTGRPDTSRMLLTPPGWRGR